MPFMQRDAGYFEVYKTCEAMEVAGAEVVSVAFAGMQKPSGALQESPTYIVVARVPEGVDFDDIDKAISLAVYGEEEEEDGD